MQVQFRRQKKVIGQAALAALSQADHELFATIAERRKKRQNSLVMVVDDDEISRVLATNVIGKKYEWISVEDGQHALSTYITHAPDAIILDIGLPDIDGHEVLECVSYIDPEAYVVMYSKHNEEKDVLLAIEEGAQGFVIKPFKREKLFHYIDRSPHLIEKKRQLEEWEKTGRRPDD